MISKNTFENISINIILKKYFRKSYKQRALAIQLRN